jgi:ABC-2 type transport system permease protein
MITAIFTASAIMRERERCTMEQLIVTPARSWELVVVKITPYVLVALFNTLERILNGSWCFGVSIRSSMMLNFAILC